MSLGPDESPGHPAAVISVVEYDPGAVGYRYTPEAEADDPARRVFREGPADPARLRTHHLHVTELGGFYRQRMLAFRDRLREHPDEAAAYVTLKRELASRFANESRR